MSERARFLLELFLLFGGAFAACMALTPIFRSLARRFGFVDRPDGRRKIHATAVPVVGGVVVFLSFVLVLASTLGRLTIWRDALLANAYVFVWLMAACGVIVLVGIFDDARGLPGKVKLVGQIFAVSMVIYGGSRIDGLTVFGYRLTFGPGLAILVTAGWLLLAINSLNLLDGMDGLLGSVGLVLCLTIGTMAFLSNHVAAACLAVTLAGALLGFLWYNFPPATIFLGDAGSMLIGLVVGTLAIEASLKGPAAVGLVVPMTIMVVPILDTTAAIIRRRFTGRSIFATDRGHLHHMLMNRGFTKRQVLVLVVAMSTIVSAGAIISQWQKNQVYALGTALAVVGFVVVFRLFGNSELELVKQRLAATLRSVRAGDRPGPAHEIKVHLQGSGDWEEIWSGLTSWAEEMELRTLCLDVNAPAFHEAYHGRWERAQKELREIPGSGFWRVEIPLSVRGSIVGRLEVIGLRTSNSTGYKLSSLGKLVEGLEQAISDLIDRSEKKTAEKPVLV